MAAITGRTYEHLRRIFNTDTRVGNLALDPILLTQRADDAISYMTSVRDDAHVKQFDITGAAGDPSVRIDDGVALPVVAENTVRYLMGVHASHDDAALTPNRILLGVAYDGGSVAVISNVENPARHQPVIAPLYYPLAQFSELWILVDTIAVGAQLRGVGIVLDVPIGAVRP